MAIPSTGFVIHVKRLRTEKRGSGSGTRYRTVGEYACYFNGSRLTAPDLSGATVEPRGPGDNSSTGRTYGRCIEPGKYQLGTHDGTKYDTFGYKKNARPRPGIYVHDTQDRTAILIHMGSGFKASVGCINITGSIVGPHDDIGPNTSFARMEAFINAMKSRVPGFPSSGARRLQDAWLVIS